MSSNPGPLLTDLYQLNMLAAYLEHGLTETAVFELFVRNLPAKARLPDGGGPGAGARLSRKSGLLGGGHRPLRAFRRVSRNGCSNTCGTLRFTGDVDALPEGTVFFPDEPILRVIAPLPQAQLVETRLINLVHFETVDRLESGPDGPRGQRQAAGRFRAAPCTWSGSRHARRPRQLSRRVCRDRNACGWT